MSGLVDETGAKVQGEDEVRVRFLSGDGDLSTDPRLALLATCIVSQQAAGFREAVDLRESKCPDCGSPGFNTGWGAWVFTCGAEWLTDGEPASQCTPSTP